jgi:TIGR03009 family protein
MRRAILILASLFVTAALLHGQPGNAPAPFDPTKYPEDWLLAKWEDAMSKLESFVADCELTSIDKVFNAKDVFTGKAKFLRTKTASMGSLELYKEVSKGVQSKESFKKFIYTGTFLYNFVPENKVIVVHDMSSLGQGMDNNPLTIIFGMKAADAKQRYDLKWLPPDNSYYYLEVGSKLAKDKQDFKQARLVFLKSNFLLRQVWFVEANGNTVIWEFPTASVNSPLKVTDFTAPQVPAGWRMEKAPALTSGKAPG